MARRAWARQGISLKGELKMPDVKIEIPAFDVKQTVRFLVTGKTALLMHNPASMLKTVGPPGTKTQAQRIPKPEDEAEAGTYKNTDGSFCFPAQAFRKAIVSASKGLRAGKAGVPGLVMAGVFPVGEWVNLLDEETGKPIRKYEIDIRRAVPKGQGAVSRARPKIPYWKCIVEIEVNESFLPVDVVLKLLQRAGEIIGIGDYRPEKGGRFGKFKAELMK